MADKDDAEKSIAEDLVVTKYKMAAEITNKTLKTVIEESVVGASVRDLCKLGDQILREETGKQFKREKDFKKGIAFPTCISVNNCICYYAPLNSEPDYVLKDGDVAKIDLGAHIDGFIAVVAHTIVVGHGPKSGKVTGRKADVILAAHYASEAALRLVKPSLETIAKAAMEHGTLLRPMGSQHLYRSYAEYLLGKPPKSQEELENMNLRIRDSPTHTWITTGYNQRFIQQCIPALALLKGFCIAGLGSEGTNLSPIRRTTNTLVWTDNKTAALITRCVLGYQND